MTHKELQQAQKEFAIWLATNPGAFATGVCKNSDGMLCLCVYHTKELNTQGKKRIATELGDIPLIFKCQDKLENIKGAWDVKQIV